MDDDAFNMLVFFFGVLFAFLAIGILIIGATGGEHKTFEEECADKGGSYAVVGPNESCLIDGVLVQED